MRLERSSIRSVLGLRFRDATTERPVTEGLRVTVRRKDGRGPPTRAVRTASGAYVAQGLAGLRAYERVPEDIPEDIPDDSSDVNNGNEADPLVKKNYLVDVRDRRGRFVPVLLEVNLPYTPRAEFGGLRSITETPSDIEAEESAQETPEPTCYLFSAVQRPVTAGQSVVYADLVVKEEGAWQPAAHAVMEVRYDSGNGPTNSNSNEDSNGDGNGGAVWYGVADAEGRVAVQFPMPAVEQLGDSSGSGRLSNYTWQLDVSVRYQPSTLTIPSEAERPPLPAILNQKQALLYTDSNTREPAREETLHNGQPLVLKTDGLPGGRTALRVAPDTG